jgi:hypothetical protein
MMVVTWLKARNVGNREVKWFDCPRGKLGGWGGENVGEGMRVIGHKTQQK